MRDVLGVSFVLADLGVAVKWLFAGIGLALGLVLAGVWQQTRLQAVQVEFEQYRSEQYAALTDAQAEAIEAEARVTEREHKLQEITDEIAAQAADMGVRLADAGAALADAERRLLDAYAAASAPGKRAAAGAAADAAQRGEGEPDPKARGMSADVFGGAVRALSAVGRYADELELRALTCERTVDAWLIAENPAR